MKLPLAYYGNPILRKKTSRVNEITDEIRQLVSDMVETMHEYNGIGLAAPQVSRSLSLFITDVPIEIDEGKEEPRLEPGKLRVYINPKILSYSKEHWPRGEGCISIPGIYGEVVRPVSIIVEATNLDGKLFEEEYSWLEARAIMHENDHINGVLYIDRMHGKARKDMDRYLTAIKKKYSK